MSAPVVDFLFLQEDDVIPEPPSSDVPQGVLPRLIATLVNRRRQVKALMKDKTASTAKLLQVRWTGLSPCITADGLPKV
jgi:hypothetical protein